MTTVGQEAIQSFGELSGKKSSQPIDGSSKERVVAWRASRSAPYSCPECMEPVFLKDGPVKIAHFSHYPESSCGYGTGEGERHMRMKMEVMKALEDFEGVEFERAVIPGRRADVGIPSDRVAVECQVSPMHPEEWLGRTLAYSRRGWAVLWVWDTKRCGAPVDVVPEEILTALTAHRNSYGHLTLCDPESGEFFAASLSRGRGRTRTVRYKLLQRGSLNKLPKTEDGLRTVSLVRGPWWKR